MFLRRIREMKRLLNCTTSEMLSMNKDELKQSILASEGRTIMTETVVACQPLLNDLTNAELAVSFGSDMVLLNVFDCDNPHINGLPETDEPVKLLKKLVGRPVGCNLEPIDENAKMMENRLEISHGRHATKETFIKAKELGFDFICLTGNPGTGVSNASIENAIKLAKEYFGGMIIAGKMHSSGIDEALVDLPSIERFIDAGADKNKIQYLVEGDCCSPIVFASKTNNLEMLNFLYSNGAKLKLDEEDRRNFSMAEYQGFFDIDTSPEGADLLVNTLEVLKSTKIAPSFDAKGIIKLCLNEYRDDDFKDLEVNHFYYFCSNEGIWCRELLFNRISKNAKLLTDLLWQLCWNFRSDIELLKTVLQKGVNIKERDFIYDYLKQNPAYMFCFK